MTGTTYDPEKFQLTVARLKRGGHTFEVVVNPDEALDYHLGKQVNLRDVLKYEKIFMDAQKGLLASANAMKEIFGSDEPVEVADVVLKDGEVHFTTKFKQDLRERKHKAVVERIHRFGVDPRTNAPHSLERIKRAMEQSKVRVDEFKSAEEQATQIVKKLQPILPIRFETKAFEVAIPGTYAPKVYGQLTQEFQVNEQQWLDDGSWQAKMVIPGGLVEYLYDRLNNLTQGTAQIDEIQTR